MSSSESTFPRPENRTPVRRVITGHSPDGRSIVIDESSVEPHPYRSTSSTLFTNLFWSESNPPENGVKWADLELQHGDELVGPDGSSLRAVEMPPGAVAPFHRTVTLDYGVVTHGTITLILDDDRRVKLSQGDVIVQRGTIHGWLNEGTEWTRCIFVMLPSKKVEIAGQQLEEEFHVPRK